jgi:hypothetical protein
MLVTIPDNWTTGDFTIKRYLRYMITMAQWRFQRGPGWSAAYMSRDSEVSIAILMEGNWGDMDLVIPELVPYSLVQLPRNTQSLNQILFNCRLVIKSAESLPAAAFTSLHPLAFSKLWSAQTCGFTKDSPDVRSDICLIGCMLGNNERQLHEKKYIDKCRSTLMSVQEVFEICCFACKHDISGRRTSYTAFKRRK